MLRSLPIACLLFLGILGCKSVQRDDLVGTWVIMDASREVLPAELRKAQGKIVLDAKGTFVASEMPGLFYFPGVHSAQLETGSGTWRLEHSEGEQQVWLDFQIIADWKNGLPYGTQLEVSRSNLFYFLGDADEGRRIEFEKKKMN
ncbi:MAG: hypothetical protein ABSC48_07585 [Terracidiphilus sp.]|jgi:hypothetical protein